MAKSKEAQTSAPALAETPPAAAVETPPADAGTVPAPAREAAPAPAETAPAAAVETPPEELTPIEDLAAALRLPSWQSAALHRLMGWGPGKRVTAAEYDAGLVRLKTRRIGG
jgi:hypothetical protein